MRRSARCQLPGAEPESRTPTRWSTASSRRSRRRPRASTSRASPCRRRWAGHHHRHDPRDGDGEALMAVTTSEQRGRTRRHLGAAFKGTESAILVDFNGLKVPEVTELRRQVRGAKATYKVVKNTLARRALKGTAFEPLSEHFVGTTAVAYAGEDPVALAKVLTTFAKTAPALQIKAAVVQGRAIKAGRGHRPRGAARQAGALREAPVPAAGADGAAGQRAERRAARSDERVGAGGRRSRNRNRGKLPFQLSAANAEFGYSGSWLLKACRRVQWPN